LARLAARVDVEVKAGAGPHLLEHRLRRRHVRWRVVARRPSAEILVARGRASEINDAQLAHRCWLLPSNLLRPGRARLARRGLPVQRMLQNVRISCLLVPPLHTHARRARASRGRADAASRHASSVRRHRLTCGHAHSRTRAASRPDRPPTGRAATSPYAQAADAMGSDEQAVQPSKGTHSVTASALFVFDPSI